MGAARLEFTQADPEDTTSPWDYAKLNIWAQTEDQRVDAPTVHQEAWCQYDASDSLNCPMWLDVTGSDAMDLYITGDVYADTDGDGSADDALSLNIDQDSDGTAEVDADGTSVDVDPDDDGTAEYNFEGRVLEGPPDQDTTLLSGVNQDMEFRSYERMQFHSDYDNDGGAQGFNFGFDNSGNDFRFIPNTLEFLDDATAQWLSRGAIEFVADEQDNDSGGDDIYFDAGGDGTYDLTVSELFIQLEPTTTLATADCDAEGEVGRVGMYDDGSNMQTLCVCVENGAGTYDWKEAVDVDADGTNDCP